MRIPAVVETRSGRYSTFSLADDIIDAHTSVGVFHAKERIQGTGGAPRQPKFHSVTPMCDTAYSKLFVP